MSASTRRGWWKAPIRFLPRGVLMPVLPPTEESTCASSVVGICTKSTPRAHAGRGKAGEVADHAAAERDHEIAALDARVDDRFADVIEGREALGALARRQRRSRVQSMPRGFERGLRAGADDAAPRSRR